MMGFSIILTPTVVLLVIGVQLPVQAQRNEPSACESAGGKCIMQRQNKSAGNKCNGIIAASFECHDQNKKCCIEGCPKAPGFFQLNNPVTKCYGIFSDETRNWIETKKLCEDNGMTMVQPVDIISLRSYIIQTFGYQNSWLWLAGRGTRNNFQWTNAINIKSNAINILNKDPLWMENYPMGFTSNNYCLGMDARWEVHSDRAYAAWLCTWKGGLGSGGPAEGGPDAGVFAFCEVPM